MMGVQERVNSFDERLSKIENKKVESKVSKISKFKVSKVSSTNFTHDFSTDEVSEDLKRFQTKLLEEAFNEEYNSRDYHIQHDDMVELRNQLLKISSGLFATNEDDMGPWAFARQYCQLRLQQAEERALENKKKRLLTKIAEQFLSKVKTHQEFEEVESLILQEMDHLTARFDSSVETQEQLVKIDETINRSLEEAAVLLTASNETEKEKKQEKEVENTSEGSEGEAKKVVQDEISMVKSRGNTSEKPHILEVKKKALTDQELILSFVNAKTQKIDMNTLLALPVEQQIRLFVMSGIDEEVATESKFFKANIEHLVRSIERSFQ